MKKLALAIALSLPASASADASFRPASVGGYFRVMARPDLQGGIGRLGFWNLYGRLLNEGPWAALELRVHVVPKSHRGDDPWTNLHLRIEGGGVANAEATGGKLGEFRLSQLYVESGNLLFPGATFRLGTLDFWYGDLGLYDMRPAQLFHDTLGAMLRVDRGPIEAIVAIGDSGFYGKGLRYAPILTIGGALRVRPIVGHLEFGVGAELGHEPRVPGNRNAPHDTPGLGYEDWLRGEFVERWLDDNPGREDAFPKPEPVSATSGRAVAYLGFGDAGPLAWNNLFANVVRRHPDTWTRESYGGRDYDLYVRSLTDQRFELTAGNELSLRIVPERLDLAWAVLGGNRWDRDNDIAPSDADASFVSTVLRAQIYLSQALHLLVESSVAEERSRNGNRYRNHFDSIFVSSDGRANDRGLEFGDADTRRTWQGKGGVVLSPLGPGLWTRPSLRLLYGAQWSSMNAAWGNGFVETLRDYDAFESKERHWHHVIAIEAEAWF